MRISFAFFIVTSLVSACSPQGEQITLGPPLTRALKTTELASDAKGRLSILGKQTNLQNNALFTAYNRKRNSQWNSGWTRRLDFTGVSWAKRQAGTAITPRHIVFAAHFKHKVGSSISFHERNGAVHHRRIEKIIAFRGQSVPLEYRSDIAVALLDRPLPPTIKAYRLLPPRIDYRQTLVNSPVIVTEQGRRAYIHKVRMLPGNRISFTKNGNVPEQLYKPLIKGDSGHPSFLLVGGELVLVETHTGGGPGSGPFYSSPPLFKALEKAVADLDPSYKIKTVPLNPQLAPALPKATASTTPTKAVPQTRSSPTPPNTGQPTTPSTRIPRVRRVPTPSE